MKAHLSILWFITFLLHLCEILFDCCVFLLVVLHGIPIAMMQIAWFDIMVLGIISRGLLD